MTIIAIVVVTLLLCTAAFVYSCITAADGDDQNEDMSQAAVDQIFKSMTTKINS